MEYIGKQHGEKSIFPSTDFTTANSEIITKRKPAVSFKIIKNGRPKHSVRGIMRNILNLS